MCRPLIKFISYSAMFRWLFFKTVIYLSIYVTFLLTYEIFIFRTQSVMLMRNHSPLTPDYAYSVLCRWSWTFSYHGYGLLMFWDSSQILHDDVLSQLLTARLNYLYEISATNTVHLRAWSFLMAGQIR